MHGWKSTSCHKVILALTMISGLAQAADPEIKFTEIPAFGKDGKLKGKVENVRGGQYSVAVYIYVFGWWSKPSADAPLTRINRDGSWECSVSFSQSDRRASRYAAFLVPSDFTPPVALGSPTLPEALHAEAVAHAAQSRPAGREIEFSGYTWWVKDSAGNPVGPGPNYFSGSEENVWVDDEGRLHLRITKKGDQWHCAEIVSVRSFGYGTYRVYLDTPVEEVDLNAILGLFTWSDSPEYTHREIDVEITKWSDPEDSDNAQFVVQPWTTPGNRERYRIPEDEPRTTHCFEWTAKRIKFISYENHFKNQRSADKKCESWSYSGSDVPQAGDENYRMNLWLNEGMEPSDGEGMEVVVSRFEFIPSE